MLSNGSSKPAPWDPIRAGEPSTPGEPRSTRGPVGPKRQRIYNELVSLSPSGPQVALDAAETLIDNGHLDQARDFLERASALAKSAGVPWVEDMANHHLESLSRKQE